MGCDDYKENSCHVLKFEHKHSFIVVNLREIVSVKVEDFHADWVKKSSPDKVLIWGRYNLVVQYLKYQKKGESSAEKVLSKVFSHFLPPTAGCAYNKLNNDKRGLISKIENNFSVTPVPLFLFPLLGKIKFTPFKVTVITQGIIKVPLSVSAKKERRQETMIRPAADLLPQKEAHIKETGISTAHPGNILTDFPVKKVVPKKKKQDAKTDPVSQRTKEVSRTHGIPIPDAHYYKTYRFFYNHFYGGQGAGKTDKK